MDPERITQQLRELLTDRDEVVTAYLFGSVARGTHHAKSDVDVAVLYTRDPPSTLDGLGLGLEGDLERDLGWPVQVIVLNKAPYDLIHRVLRDGKLLKDADPSVRVRFEVKARNLYFDLLPILRHYRQMGEGMA